MIHGFQMAFRKIHDMDIIALTRTILSRVVAAEYLQLVAAPYCNLGNEWQ